MQFDWSSISTNEHSFNMSRLVLYSSSDSDDEEQKNRKRLKLPSVNLQLKNEVDLEDKESVAANTDRIRSFPHERGNWALSIYAFGKRIVSFSSFCNASSFCSGLFITFGYDDR